MGRRKLAALVITVIALGLVSGVAVWQWPVFRVKEIAVQGNEMLGNEEIVAASGVRLGTNMVKVDTKSAADHVADLQWVEKATVVTSFPSTVKITVAERYPVLFVVRDDGPHLIDRTGTPFISAPPPPGVTPVEDSGTDDPAVYADIVAVLGSLDDQLRAQISAVKAPSRYEITVVTVDGRAVYWGSNERNADKARAMKIALTKPGKNVDVSNPALITVK